MRLKHTLASLARLGLAVALLCCWPAVALATFPGQNGKIAFGLTTQPGGIHVIEPHGTGLTRLIDRGSDAVWSPDGRRLAFRKTGADVGITNGLYVANADGSGQTLVRADTEFNPTPQTHRSNYGYEPTWSADGSAIAYTAEERFCAERFGCVFTPLGIRAINPDGSGDRLVLDRFANAAAYSPDGTRIAWLDHHTAIRPGLHVSNSDGTGDTVLVPVGEPAWPSSPSWSPDSSRIAFSRAVGTETHFDIHVMGADGSDRTRLTFDGVNGSPVWSPDGTKIAWIRSGRLWIMNADGSDQAMLTSEATFVTNVDWQPLVGPRRADYKNASHFCKALRAFLGDQEFAQRYRNHGGCVSGGQRR